MGERLAAFAPSLHADKTRLIEFGRFSADLVAGSVAGYENPSCEPGITQPGGSPPPLPKPHALQPN